MRRLPLLLALTLCLITGVARPAGAQSPALEDKIKAAYLFNFLRFTDWPGLEKTGPGSTLRLCLVGADSIAQLLAEVANRDINGHAIAIESLGSQNLRRASQCQIVFIDRRAGAGALAESLARESVLTVSDAPAFAESGGIIGFYQDEGRVKIAVNLRRAREARVSLSSKLLEVARLVD